MKLNQLVKIRHCWNIFLHGCFKKFCKDNNLDTEGFNYYFHKNGMARVDPTAELTGEVIFIGKYIDINCCLINLINLNTLVLMETKNVEYINFGDNNNKLSTIQISELCTY